MRKKQAMVTNAVAAAQALRQGVRALSSSSTDYSSFALIETRPLDDIMGVVVVHVFIACLYIGAAQYVLAFLSDILTFFIREGPIQLWSAVQHGHLLFVFNVVWRICALLLMGFLLGIAVKFFTEDLRAYYKFLRSRKSSPHSFPLNMARPPLFPSLWLPPPHITLMQPDELKQLLEKDEERATAQADALLATMDIVEKDDQPPFNLIMTLTDHLSMTLMTHDRKKETKEICGAYAAPLFFLAAQPKGSLVPMQNFRKAIYLSKCEQIFGLHRTRCNEDLHALARKVGVLPSPPVASSLSKAKGVSVSRAEAGEAHEPVEIDEVPTALSQKGQDTEGMEATESQKFDLFQNVRDTHGSCWQLLPHYEVVEYPVLNAFYEQVQMMEGTTLAPEEVEAALPLAQVRQQVARVWSEYGKGYGGENQTHHKNPGKWKLWPWTREKFMTYRDRCLKIFQYAAIRELDYAPVAPSDEERLEAFQRAAQLYEWSAFVAAGLIPDMERATKAFKECINLYKSMKCRKVAKNFCRAYEEYIQDMAHPWEVPEDIRALWPELFPPAAKKQAKDDTQ